MKISFAHCGWGDASGRPCVGSDRTVGRQINLRRRFV